MNNPPQTIIFDLGKVLVDFDYAISARKLATKCHRSPAEVRKLIDHSPLLFQYETGLIDKSEFYRKICALTGYSGSQEEFEPTFSDIFTPIEPMIALHAELRRRKLPTFVLSNTNDLAGAHIRRTFPFFANFDGYIFSHEQRGMKPHPRIYEIAETITGRSEDQIVYIDDRAENVEPGRGRGWNVIHHESPQKTIAALQKLGLLEGWAAPP